MYNFNEDFKYVTNIFIKENLSNEELKEGLTPITYDVKVCLTTHAYNRMFNTVGRGVEIFELKEILLKLGDELLNLGNNNRVIILTKDKTFAVVGSTHYQDGDLAFIVHTVIRVETAMGFKKLKFKDEDREYILVV